MTRAAGVAIEEHVVRNSDVNRRAAEPCGSSADEFFGSIADNRLWPASMDRQPHDIRIELAASARPLHRARPRKNLGWWFQTENRYWNRGKPLAKEDRQIDRHSRFGTHVRSALHRYGWRRHTRSFVRCD